MGEGHGLREPTVSDRYQRDGTGTAHRSMQARKRALIVVCIGEYRGDSEQGYPPTNVMLRIHSPFKFECESGISSKSTVCLSDSSNVKNVRKGGSSGAFTQAQGLVQLCNLPEVPVCAANKHQKITQQALGSPS